MSALPILTVTREGETIRSQSLEKEVSIGRAEGNVIRLEDRAVSRKHAIVRKTEEGVHIEKQSDFAPIRLNGVECTRALLKEGDVVEIGPFRMRLDTPKEPVREAPRLAAVPAPVVEEGPKDPDATVAIPAEAIQTPELAPSEGIGLGPVGESPSIGEFTGSIQMPADSRATLEAAPDLAQPILADAVGADAGSQDPGTNIFPNGGGEDAAVEPLEIDFGSAPGSESLDLPSEISAGPFDENAATKVISTDVKARLEIAEGMANVTQLGLVKDEIIIGRGKECDIVLNDKKSSRKNTLIVRDGNHYRVKDLDSSNGTFVNGSPVKDVELSADDMIRVGEVEIRFVADSAHYEKKKASFDSVEPPPAASPAPEPGPMPGYLAPEGLSPFTPPAGGMPVGYSAPFMGSAAAPAAAAPLPVVTRKGIFGIIDKYIKNFGTLKPMQKVLVILCGFLFVSWYFEDELGLNTPEKPAPHAAAKKTGDGKTGPTDFDSLPAAKQAEIEESIRKATDFLRTQDFDKVLYEIQTHVYPILPNYPQAKELERYAQEGKRRKDAIEAETKRKDDEAKLKSKIAELETATQGFMAKKQYDQAKDSFSQILEIDPDNPNVAGWKKEIEAWTEEQDRIAKEKEVQIEINKRAWDTYNEGFELHKAGKYREAIELYKKVAELGADDQVLLKKSLTMVQTCQDSIRELRDPHLKKGEQFEKDGDLASAFKEYKAATEIDPPHPDGWAGMDRIRDVLTARAKILYTEAVIAESYSDFKTAYSKYNEIMKLAPDESLYYQRAQRKLQSYLNFHPDEATQ